eukprot:701644-Prorocentrum_minimum.AAC.2
MWRVPSDGHDYCERAIRLLVVVFLVYASCIDAGDEPIAVRCDPPPSRCALIIIVGGVALAAHRLANVSARSANGPEEQILLRE